MSAENAGATVRLEREEGFRFRVRFGDDGIPAIVTDEPAPVGGGAGPNPSALLAAAIGNCLASSLLFCLQKARVEVRGLEAEVRTTTVRNEAGRMRIGDIRVTLSPTVTPETREKMGRCLELFESFCVVTESVRHGVEVNVAVEPQVSKGAGDLRAPPQSAPPSVVGGA